MKKWTLLAAAVAGTLAAQAKPSIIYAVRYATIPNLQSPDWSPRRASRKMDIAMMVCWRAAAGNILVDAGFYREQFFKQWHVTDYMKPSDAVRAASPEEITDIIVTHMHWDHADGMDLFPNARVWCRRTSNTTPARPGNRGGTHGGIDPDDVIAAVNSISRANSGW